MTHYINSIYTTVCPEQLKDYIDSNTIITTHLLEIIHGDGPEYIFEFANEPSASEIAELDNILANFVCTPPPENPIDSLNFDDNASANTNVIWSSNKILGSYANKSTTITGQNSITGGGDLSSNRVIELTNDLNNPGINKFYGTNITGTKGWYDQSSDLLASSLIGSIHQMVFNAFGNIGNQWITYYGDSKYSYETHGIMPFQSKLIAVTWSCETDGADVSIKLYSSPEGGGSSPTTLDLQWNLTNKRIARKTNFASDIIFDAGDKLGVYIQDIGKRPSNVNVVFYFQIIAINSEESGEDFTGHF